MADRAGGTGRAGAVSCAAVPITSTASASPKHRRENATDLASGSSASPVHDAAPPRDGRVRVRIRRIRGSDLHDFHRGGFGAVRSLQPMILGHM